MKLDAHQHYWKLSRGDYGWLTPELGVLYRDYLPEDLKPLLATNGIDRTIVVQAAPTVEETEFMLELSNSEESIAGVVGWLDLEADDFGKQLERLRQHPRFVGLRPMLQELEDEQWILQDRVLENVKLMADWRVPLDILINPGHLPHIVRLLEAVPGLRGVVDHLAKPDIRSGVFEPWSRDLAEVSKHEGVYCKLSGMVTEADPNGWKTEDFTPYVHHVVEHFGTKRVMFGSDWPVCLLAADYGQVVRLLEDALPGGLDPEAMEDIFGGNAAHFYGISQ